MRHLAAVVPDKNVENVHTYILHGLSNLPVISDVCTDCKRTLVGVTKLLSAMEDLQRRFTEVEKALHGNVPVEHQFLRTIQDLTLAHVGGGLVQPPLRFFCDAPRTMRRIVLKFCTAYGASFAQLLIKKF